MRARTLYWYVALIIGFALSTSAFEFNFGVGNLTFERALALPLLLLSMFVILVQRDTPFSLWTPYLLFLWLVWAFFSSLLSDVSDWAIKMWVVLLLATIFYYLPFLYKANLDAIFKSSSFRFLAWVLGPISSFIYLLSVLGGLELPGFLGGWLQEGSGGLRLRATILEANLFGCFLIPIILVIFAQGGKRDFSWWLLVIGLHTSMIFSFSRAPWLAYLVSLLIYFLLSYPFPYSKRRLRKVLGNASLAIIFGGAVLAALFLYFSDEEIVGRTNTIATRFVMWELALADIEERPLLGMGIFSFSELHPSAPLDVGSDTYRAAWISNLFLAVFHDTGLVGSLFFLAFLIVSIFRAVRCVRRSIVRSGQLAGDCRFLSALVASGVAFVVAGQSIPAHSLGFFWVVFGLIDRSVLVMQRKLRAPLPLST